MLLAISSGSGWDVPTMNSAVSQAMNWTVVIGAFLATSFISVKFAWEYFKYSLGSAQGNDVSVVWDWQEIVRVVFILILLGSYKPLSEGVIGGLRSINEITQKDTSMNDQLTAAANKHYIASMEGKKNDLEKILVQKYNAEGDQKKKEAIKKLIDNYVAGTADGTVDGGDANVVSQFNEGVENMTGENGGGNFISMGISMAFNGLTYLLSSIIKWVVGTFIKMIFQIGIVFGPIVLAFGIFFRDKPIQYMNQMLAIGFVFTTLNILDMLFMNFVMHSFADPSGKEAIAFNLAMIGAYLSAFKITQMFIGVTGLNSLMGRGLGVAGGFVAGALSVGGMAATGGGSAAMGAASKGVQKTTRERLD